MHRNSERDSKNNDSVAQLVEQMTLNHWVESSSLSGVTRQSIKMQKTSEIQTISEVFRYPQPAFLRRILKWRGVPKGYIANRSGDCTLARVLNAIVQEFTPFPDLSDYSVEPAFEGTSFSSDTREIHFFPILFLSATSARGRGIRYGQIPEI